MTDNEKEALILQFDEGVEFISKALETGAVLVHWWVYCAHMGLIEPMYFNATLKHISSVIMVSQEVQLWC